MLRLDEGLQEVSSLVRYLRSDCSVCSRSRRSPW